MYFNKAAVVAISDRGLVFCSIVNTKNRSISVSI